MANETVQFSKTERLILANQFRMLEALFPKEADYYGRAGEIVEYGWSLEYGDLVERFTDGLTHEQCVEVKDILDMHRALNGAYNDLEDKSGVDANDLRFRGFDGNNETEYMGYARFLVKTKRWEEVGKGDLNSHMQTLPRYRKMLEHWNASADKFALTKDDITRIVGRTGGLVAQQ